MAIIASREFDENIWFPSELNTETKKRKKRESKNQYTLHDRRGSTFYKNYFVAPGEESPLRDEKTKKAKKFRRRFRVPYCVFESICADMRLSNLYQDGTDAKGEPKIELELLVMAALRYLGSGCPFDLLEELTCIGAGTINKFFHHLFCVWGARASEVHIRLPENDEELQHVMGLYEKLGLAGCAGSMDCVHFVWDKCPAGLNAVCKGKEKHPTLAFELIASHTKKILSVSQFFWGATNDKSIARYDESVEKVRSSDSFLRKVKWQSYNRSGEIQQDQGAYYICDGGYHEWQCLIPPYKHQLSGTDEATWSKHVELTRKDVECVFGILKKRFLFLKHPIRLHSPEQIQNAFVTCCVLHNILLNIDGYNDWELHDVEWDDEVEHTKLEKRAEEIANKSKSNGVSSFTRSEMRRQDTSSFSFEDEGCFDVSGSEKAECQLFKERRSCLIDRYHYLVGERKLKLHLK